MYGRATNTYNRSSLANYLTLIFGEILLKRKSRSVHKMVLFSSEVVNIGFRSNHSTTKNAALNTLKFNSYLQKHQRLRILGFHKFLLSNFGKHCVQHNDFVFFYIHAQPAKASVSPCSSPLRMFREEERLRLSNRNSILMT